MPQQVKYIRLNWRRLAQRIRRNYPRIEYLAALELTATGTPHLHILTRGDYLPQKWLSKAWCQLTGAYIVHIRKVDRVPGALAEVTKYLTKTAAELARLCPGKPVVTHSRGWLPPDFDEDYDSIPADLKGTFVHLSFKCCSDIVQDLGGYLRPAPDKPSHYIIVFPQGPDVRRVHQGLELGSFGEATFLTLIFHQYLAAVEDPHSAEDYIDLLALERFGPQQGA